MGREEVGGSGKLTRLQAPKHLDRRSPLFAAVLILPHLPGRLEVVMCGSVVGRQSHGFLEMSDSIVDPVQFHQGGAEVSVDIRLVGADAEGCFECCNAILYLIRLKIGEAEQFIGWRPTRRCVKAAGTAKKCARR